MSNQRLLKNAIIVIAVTLIIILTLIVAPYITQLFNSGEKEQTVVGYSDETVRARVLAVQEQGPAEVAGRQQTYQVLEIQILEGTYEQQRLMLELGNSQILPEDYLLKPGDVVLVNVAESMVTGKTAAYFVDFVRENAIIIVFLIFSLVAVLIGGKTGLRSLLGSLVGMAIIALFVIPQILNGKSPLLVSIIGAAMFLGFSLYVVYGWKGMTHVAVIGMVFSLFLTGLFSVFAVRLTRLTGYGDENVMFLVQQSQNTIDMRGILIAGIIISSLGVLDDLVVGQSSAVFQLYETNPSLSVKDLYKRAMVIGRDHVAASVNTLILAYAGESLPMLLLFSLTNVDMRLALNVSYITEEIVQALAGTTGLFMSIPIATFIACRWVKGPGRKKEGSAIAS